MTCGYIPIERQTVRDAEIRADVTRTGILFIRQKEEPKQKRAGGMSFKKISEIWESKNENE